MARRSATGPYLSKGPAAPADKPWAYWLRVVRVLANLTPDEFADRIGKSTSAIYMYERGDRNIPPDVLAAVVEKFTNLPPMPDQGEVKSVPSPLVKELQIPYAGIVPRASNWGIPLESTESKQLDAEFARDDRYTTEVVGPSALPFLQEGDLAVWQEDEDPSWGVIVLAQNPSGQACAIKVETANEARGRTMLRPLNTEIEHAASEQGWKIVAKLIGVIRRGEGPPRSWGPWEPGLRPEHLT